MVTSTPLCSIRRPFQGTRSSFASVGQLLAGTPEYVPQTLLGVFHAPPIVRAGRDNTNKRQNPISLDLRCTYASETLKVRRERIRANLDCVLWNGLRIEHNGELKIIDGVYPRIFSLASKE